MCVMAYICKVDDALADISDVTKSLKNKGCITISLRFITRVRPSMSRDQNRKRSHHGLEKLGAVSEKALKGDDHSHQVT